MKIQQGIWLGTYEYDTTLSMGDFGPVKACFHYEMYKSKDGYFCGIFSCRVLVFGVNGKELLHRLEPTRKTQLEEFLSAEFKNREDEYD